MRENKRVVLKGVASHPEEIISEDGTLDCAVNLINDGGGLKPLFPPKSVDSIPVGFKIIYIHRHTGYIHYILKDLSGNLAYQDQGVNQTTPIDTKTTQIEDVVHIGNTLLLLSTSGIEYQLWKDGKYKRIGDKMPELDIRFGIGDQQYNNSSPKKLSSSINSYLVEKSEEEIAKFFSERQSDEIEVLKAELNNEVISVANQLIQTNTIERGRFASPFLVRYAYRLFDGTLSHHSQPVLMIPSTGSEAVVFYSISPGILSGTVAGAVSSCSLYKSIINQAQIESLKQWSDVIKSVDVFISAPFYKYKQSGKIRGYTGKSIDCLALTIENGWKSLYTKSDNGALLDFSILLPEYETSEVEELVKSCGDFYFLKSYQIKDLTTTTDKIDVAPNYLGSIVNRERMSDDWDSHDTLVAKRAFVYNGRVNLSGLSKKLHKWNKLSNIIPLQPKHPYKMAAVVKMNVEGDTKSFNTEEVFGNKWTIPRYIYVGNNNTTSMSFYTRQGIIDIPLEQHTTLNGAVHVDLSSAIGRTDWHVYDTYPALPPESATSVVQLPNKLYTSELNNPFNFPVLGINTVGTGEILNVSSALKALSPGQFGQFPLYVFTDDGIWAMGVNSEGRFNNLQPISTDVPTDPKNITQIDDMVGFMTKRGLVLLRGAESLSISDEVRDHRFDTSKWDGLDQAMAIRHEYFTKLPGGSMTSVGLPFSVSFSDIAESAKIAYDYVHKRILVYRHDRPICYVYSMRSKIWGMQSVSYSETVRSVPYSYVTNPQNQILDLSTEDTTKAVPVVLMTRSIDFESPEVLKTSYRTIIEGRHTNGNSVTVSSLLYGSNDYDKYGLLHTSVDNVLAGRSGSPVKAVRVAMIGGYTKDNYTSATTHTIESKRSNKIR